MITLKDAIWDCFTITYSNNDHCFTITYSNNDHCFTITYSNNDHCFTITYSNNDHCFTITYSNNDHCFTITYSNNDHCLQSLIVIMIIVLQSLIVIMIIVLQSLIVIIITLKDAIWDCFTITYSNNDHIERRNLRLFYNLLTVPGTVSNTYALVARVQSFANRATHRALFTYNMSCTTWHEGTAQL